MKRYIHFSSRDEVYRINISQIIFFVASGNYTFMQLATGQKIAFTFSLQKMHKYLIEKLGDDARIFAHIGKFHIINLNYIYHINIPKQQLRLICENGRKLQTEKGEKFELIRDEYNDKELFIRYNGNEYIISVSKVALRKLKDFIESSTSQGA